MFCKNYPAIIAALAVICLAHAGCRSGSQCNPGFQQGFNPGFQQQQFNPNFQQPFNPNLQQFNPNFQQQFNPGLQQFQGQGSSVGRNGLIPPIGTGQLNIPSVARNNLPGTNGLLNTRANAPTTSRISEFNRQNGWHPIGDNSSLRSNIATPNSNQSNSASPTNNNQSQPNPGSSVLVSNANNTNNANNNQPTAAGNNPGQYYQPNSQARVANAGYGNSFIDSPNYNTTQVNETRDGTRLPVADASNVRAPSQFYSRASGVQFAQNQNNAFANNGFATGQFVGQPNLAAASGTRGFATGGFVNDNNGFAPGNFVQNPNLVVSQATATYDPYANGTRAADADWTSRDPGSNSF